eukprot:TRINITY_DN2076_c0_g1_i1.p1 TRINITY_DN2076_c0_g1~~TRINITY_DN2076_c0_g1_i1.p1  ORF type:complete len:304 (-),score=100.60 TRINITY_DN2076_c0_g1_i1:48-959(-)
MSDRKGKRPAITELEEEEIKHNNTNSDDNDSENGSDNSEHVEVDESDLGDEKNLDDNELVAALLQAANALISEAEHSGFDDTTQEKLQKADDYFEQVLEIDAQHIEALVGRAYVAGLQENYGEANDILEFAKEMIQNNKTKTPDELKEDMKTIKIMQDELVRLRTEGEEDEKLIQQHQQEHSESSSSSSPMKDASSLTIPSLIENGVVSPLFLNILHEIFIRFDVNKDGGLNDKEISDYTKVVNGKPADKEKISFIRKTFDWNKKTGLTEPGLIELYLQQSAEEPEETYKDLHTLGYDLTDKK